MREACWAWIIHHWELFDPNLIYLLWALTYRDRRIDKADKETQNENVARHARQQDVFSGSYDILQSSHLQSSAYLQSAISRDVT